MTADLDKAAHDPVLRFIAGYPGDLQQQVLKLVAEGGLRGYLLGKYPVPHKIANDADLRAYVMALKNDFTCVRSFVNKDFRSGFFE